jgi:hypothetical protein
MGIKAEGSDTAEAVTGRNATHVLPRFTPGKEFKKEVNNVTFEKSKTG